MLSLEPQSSCPPLLQFWLAVTPPQSSWQQSLDPFHGYNLLQNITREEPESDMSKSFSCVPGQWKIYPGLKICLVRRGWEKEKEVLVPVDFQGGALGMAEEPSKEGSKGGTLSVVAIP